MTLNEHIEGLEHSIAERSWSFGMDYMARNHMEHDKEILEFLKDLKTYKRAYKLACKELGMAYGDKGGKGHRYWEIYFINEVLK